jgi:hypothetical protein
MPDFTARTMYPGAHWGTFASPGDAEMTWVDCSMERFYEAE